MPLRIAAGQLSSLQQDEVRVVALPPDRDGLPREAIVLRDEAGTPRAYLNRCCHLPIPLDAGSRRFLSADRARLQCATHGARYRRSDGYCTAGPCAGASLRALPLLAEADLLSVCLP
jgi:nitrite reductase/ring-hydroxylating ferredoxin subunit